MKRKVLYGLAVAMALVSAALINANLASTTALCQDEPKEGLCRQQGSFESEETTIKFETPVGVVSCGSYLESSATEAATAKGLPLKGTVISEFYSCTREGGGTCTAKVSNFFWTALFKWTSGGNGEVEPITGVKGPPNLTLTCTKVIECTYTFESSLEFLGGNPAKIVANKDVIGSASGVLCPGGGASISWTGTYKSTSPVYLGNTTPPVTLCKKSETPCSGENTYTVPTTFSASLESGSASKLRLKISEESEETEYTVSCAASALEGKTTSAKWPLQGELLSLSFSDCGGTCAVKMIKVVPGVQFEASGAGNGTLTWWPRLRLRCIAAYKCTYEFPNIPSSVSGGAPAKLAVSASGGKLISTESEAKCGSELKWEGTYKFTKPEASGEAKMWVVREGI